MLACGKSTHEMCELLSWLGVILRVDVWFAYEFSLEI